MFVPVTVTTNGEEMYRRGFDMLESQARDMTVPLTLVGERLLLSVDRQMESEGAWGGNPYPPLSAEYAQWKDAQHPGLKMLVGLRPTGGVGTRSNPVYGKDYEASGKMKAELLDPLSINVSPERLIYAPVSDVAGFHQEGTHDMPPRPPVATPLAELHEWDRLFVGWLNGVITEAFVA